MLALLAVLCYGAWWGWQNVIAPTPPPAAKPCVNTSVDKGRLRSSQVTVNIFNGGNKRGLAGDIARAMRAKEFKVAKVSNTEQAVSKTVIIGANAKNPEVLLVKSFFKSASVKADKRADHTVDVLVGNKYAGFNSKAKTSIAVKSQTVCLPASKSPSPAVGG
nr:LytR C-terminal domain-containing protein [Microlunatus panaciterrae]